MKKKSSTRRRQFMIDSNLSPKKRTRRVRNTFLNTLTKLLALKSLMGIFKLQNIIKVLLFSMAFFVVFALFSPYFKLKEISITRDNPSIDIELIQNELEEFYGENVLFLPKGKIEAKLKGVFPEFENIIISEQWPDRINLQIEVSPAVFTLLNAHSAKFYTLTRQGVVLPKQEDTNNIPTIKLLQYDRPVEIRSQILRPEEIQFMHLIKTFVENELKLEVKEMQYLWAAQEIHAIVHDSTELWFDVNIDPQDQFERMLLGMEEINFYSHPPAHVDLRIPSQLYWAP